MSVPNAAFTTIAAFGPLTSNSPQLSRQFSSLALVPYSRNFRQRGIGLIADLTGILQHHRVGLHVAAEVRQHFPLMGEQAGVTALAGLQGEDDRC